MDVWAVYRIRILPTRPRKDDIYQQNSKCLKGHRTKISTAVTETLILHLMFWILPMEIPSFVIVVKLFTVTASKFKSNFTKQII